MAILNNQALAELMEDREPGPHISIYMPTYRAGSEVKQNEIRFKNLLKQARNHLSNMDSLTADDIDGLLKPAQDLLSDYDFWQRQSDGLALFLTNSYLYSYRLPASFEEMVMVNERFHIKPLLPLVVNNGQFYVLAVSQKQVRLLRGSRDNISEVPLDDVPTSLADALFHEQTEKQLQYRSMGSSGGGGALFHGHDPDDEHKDRILRYFRQLDKGLHAVFGDQTPPLLLATVDYLHPIYQQANTYDNLADKGIIGNPDKSNDKELHAKAWAIVEPIFKEAQDKAIKAYNNLLNSNRSVAAIEDAVRAAHYGRVDTLLVAMGAHCWGRYDADKDTFAFDSEQHIANDDLLDIAAVRTLKTGGKVHVLPPTQMPSDTSIAAILRY